MEAAWLSISQLLVSRIFSGNIESAAFMFLSFVCSFVCSYGTNANYFLFSSLICVAKVPLLVSEMCGDSPRWHILRWRSLFRSLLIGPFIDWYSSFIFESLETDEFLSALLNDEFNQKSDLLDEIFSMG